MESFYIMTVLSRHLNNNISRYDANSPGAKAPELLYASYSRYTGHSVVSSCSFYHPPHKTLNNLTTDTILFSETVSHFYPYHTILLYLQKNQAYSLCYLT